MTTVDDLEHALAGYVHAGELAGVATLAWSDGQMQQILTVGRRDLANGLPVERDTIYRVASMTKPVTALAALTQFDEGRFDLDEPIVRYAPEFARMRVLRDPEGPLDQTDETIRPITFRDLLTHRAGLSYADFHHGPVGRAYAETLGPQIDNPLTPDEWVARLATLPLIDQPGAGFHYGHSSDLLGLLIGRVEGKPLSEVLSERVFAPLGMRDTSFAVPVEKRARRAGLCGFDAEGQLAPLTALPGGHALEERPPAMTFESGGQGLWSTLDDYLAFARMLIGDGKTPLLRPHTLAMMTSNQLTPEQRASARLLGRPVFAKGHGYGMGVAVVMEPEHADALRCRGGVGTLGWPGAYGGWWQADPDDRSVLIFLTHNMLELAQMMQGTGLGVWSAIRDFHRYAKGKRQTAKARR